MASLPRKRFGQHWLRSDRALDQIVAAAAVQASDRVLEIGPGQGALTHRLLPLAAAVVAVEIDRDLCKRLVQVFREAKNFLLLQGDILSLDWQGLLEPFPDFQGCNKVVANIPYNITGPILELLLGTIAQPRSQPFDQIVLLVQKEVAERLVAAPHSRQYGALSVRVQYLAESAQICPVPAAAFSPVPKVDSAVVRLHPRPFPVVAKDPHWLDRLVRMGFATRRKMLRNNLQPLLERAQIEQVMADLHLNPQVRAEDLSVAEWVALSNRLIAETTELFAKKS